MSEKNQQKKEVSEKENLENNSLSSSIQPLDEQEKNKEYLPLEKSKEKKELSKIDDTSSNVLKDLPVSKIHELSSLLVNGKMCPFKEESDVLICLLAGKELGLTLSSALSGIYPIEKRPSLGIHVIKGILLNNNVLFKKTHSSEPYYEFAKKNKESNKVEVLGKGFYSERSNFPEQNSKRVIDTKTQYKFTRYFTIGGKLVENTAYGLFGFSDAKTANLLNKDNWKKFYLDMEATRAFVRGAREIADDLIGGMSTPSELADAGKTKISFDSEGRERLK